MRLSLEFNIYGALTVLADLYKADKPSRKFKEGSEAVLDYIAKREFSFKEFA